MRKPGTTMRNCFFFVITVMLAVAGAGSIACSDDNDASSPLQPSPLGTATAGTGPRALPTAAPAGPAAGAGDVPGLSRVAPLPTDFNAYDARIEYRDGEVTITFVPVDMPGMPDAAREYRNRAVTVWQCPVEPHHVGQTCGEPVFRDSFAFEGSPARTFPLPDCAGWLVIEAAELSDDFYDGWRNAPLACRQDEEGRTVADVDTGGAGAGWEDSRFDPPVRGSRRPSAQSVVDAAIFAAGGLQSNLAPVSVAVSELFAGTEGTTGDEYMAMSSDETVVTVEVTDNPQVVLTPVAPGTATITITFQTRVIEFDVTVAPPAWRSLGAADLHVLDRRTSGFPAPPPGSRIELSSFSAWAVRGMPGHVLFEWSVSRGSLAPAPRTWRDCRIGIRLDGLDDYNRYHLKAGWFENGIARPLPAPYGPTDSMENPPFLDIWNMGSTVLRAFADLRPDTLVNAAFVKRMPVPTPPSAATQVQFDGFCNNYVLSENAQGQLVIQPGDAQDGSDHRSQFWGGPLVPYPVMFPSP